MNREIKYRGKTFDNDWVYGNLIKSNDETDYFNYLIIPQEDASWYENSFDDDLGVEKWYKVNSKTIGQYTGLKDKNGKEICEGDILYGGMEYYTQYGNVLVGIGECFGSEDKDEDNKVYGVYIKVDGEKFGISQNIASVYEIVGNIHDNKDLLSPYIAEVENDTLS